MTESKIATEKLIVRFEANGIGIYDIGCLNNTIWNKTEVNNLFVWAVESYYGDIVSIGAWANKIPVSIKIKLNEKIVKELLVPANEYGVIEYEV